MCVCVCLHYRLQYRRTLTHRYTLKSILRQFVAIVVRRTFPFSFELQMEIKTLLSCTLKFCFIKYNEKRLIPLLDRTLYCSVLQFTLSHTHTRERANNQ